MKNLGWAMILTILLITSAVLIWTLGSQRADSWTNPTSVQHDAVKLKFMFWGNQAQSNMYRQLFDSFSEQNPHITVEIESVPYPEYQQKISILSAGRELPDIAWAADVMVPQFLNNDILADVTPITEIDSFAIEDYLPSTLDLFQQEGRLYGLPFSVPPSVVFYNVDLFEQAGLATPAELYEAGEWTWEAFRQAARKITNHQREPAIFGANFMRDWKTWVQLSSFAWSQGSGPFDVNTTAFTWNDEHGKQTMQMLSEMILSEKSHPKIGEQVNFETGRLGMFFDVYSFVSIAREIQSFRWSIAPLPSGVEGSVPMQGQAGYVVFKESRHPELAKELLAFLSSQEGMRTTAAFFVPPRRSVLNSASFLERSEHPSVASIKQSVIDQMERARFQPDHTRWQLIDQFISEGLELMLSKELSPEQAVEWMAEQINPLLQ